ncbi:MAG: hypothetical protein H5U29_13390 [Pusillimonas sp.]|nr:hypothetical protein [Pusillimonas sp.]
MRLRLFFLAPLALVLAACQSSGGLGSGSSSAPAGSGASAAASASAVVAASSGASATSGSTSSGGGSASGDCGAGQFQNLVGTLGDSVNRSSLPAGTRVLRPTTPMSPDYRPDRLNVYIDESGQVEKVVCG